MWSRVAGRSGAGYNEKRSFGACMKARTMKEARDINDVNGNLNTTEILPYWFHKDTLGSITHMTDAAGAIVERYECTPFGQTTVYTGPGPDTFWNTADDVTAGFTRIYNPYIFQGRYLDDESGLYQFRTRHYDPNTGRFIQRDKPGDWFDECEVGNGYSFVGCFPFGALDPAGQDRDGGPYSPHPEYDGVEPKGHLHGKGRKGPFSSRPEPPHLKNWYKPLDGENGRFVYWGQETWTEAEPGPWTFSTTWGSEPGYAIKISTMSRNWIGHWYLYEKWVLHTREIVIRPGWLEEEEHDYEWIPGVLNGKYYCVYVLIDTEEGTWEEKYTTTIRIAVSGCCPKDPEEDYGWVKKSPNKVD